MSWGWWGAEARLRHSSVIEARAGSVVFLSACQAVPQMNASSQCAAWLGVSMSASFAGPVPCYLVVAIAGVACACVAHVGE